MKAEISIPVALATAAVTWGVYQVMLPPVADCRTIEPNNPDLAKSERTALIVAAGVGAGISVLAKDATPFVVGGLLAVALSWIHRHANQTDSMKQTVWNRDHFLGERFTVQAN